MTSVSGTNLTLAGVGGDFAKSELHKPFGSALDRNLVKADFVAWGRDPFTRGAYASARPEAYPLRSVLRQCAIGGGGRRRSPPACS